MPVAEIIEFFFFFFSFFKNSFYFSKIHDFSDDKYGQTRFSCEIRFPVWRFVPHTPLMRPALSIASAQH